MSAETEPALRQAVDELPAGLRRHVQRVEDEAVRLAARHGVDEQRAVLAALGHDLLRSRSPAELLALAEQLGYQPDAFERAAPVLLHGPLAARLLSERFGVADPEVLAAATWHTTARPGMSPLEKVIFLADKLEPAKSGRNRERSAIRDLGERDLDGALRRFLEMGLAYSLRRGWPLHPETVAARNELLLAAPDPGAIEPLRGDHLTPRRRRPSPP